MINWKFYHGTSSAAFETIKSHGFILTEMRYCNYLAPQGVYFVPNRPLIARRFAKLSSRNDRSQPVVLNVKLDIINVKNILDLTTDDGMNRFYQAYEEAKGIYSIHKTPKLGKNIPDEHREYMESIKIINQDIINRLNEADKYYKIEPVRFNWDTLIIQLLIDRYNIQLIIAAVQEGDTFNFSFAHHNYKINLSPNYRGISHRDHIEVCVTDLSIIDINSIQIRPHDDDMREFEEDFIGWMTNINSTDHT